MTPKVYLNDTELLSYLLGITVDRIKTEGTLAGAALENFVFMELRKQASWSTTKPEIFYWRTASGQEVDLVLEDRRGRLTGIEVKAAATLNGNDVRGLQALANAACRKWVRGVVLYTGSEVIPFANNIHGVPITHLWAG